MTGKKDDTTMGIDDLRYALDELNSRIQHDEECGNSPDDANLREAHELSGLIAELERQP